MNKQFIKLSVLVALVMVLTFTTSTTYAQCAMCRATVESNVGTGSTEPESDVGSGLNTGILYLMIIPYLLVGTIGFFWYKNNKKKSA